MEISFCISLIFTYRRKNFYPTSDHLLRKPKNGLKNMPLKHAHSQQFGELLFCWLSLLFADRLPNDSFLKRNCTKKKMCFGIVNPLYCNSGFRVVLQNDIGKREHCDHSLFRLPSNISNISIT